MKKDVSKEERIFTAGQRALKEAKLRQQNKPSCILKRELGGRDGPEPTRFGDWEKKGIISDF